jgi:hypothetical protein
MQAGVLFRTRLQHALDGRHLQFSTHFPSGRSANSRANLQNNRSRIKQLLWPIMI